jgi:hypothetical protein
MQRRKIKNSSDSRQGSGKRAEHAAISKDKNI